MIWVDCVLLCVVLFADLLVEVVCYRYAIAWYEKIAGLVKIDTVRNSF